MKQWYKLVALASAVVLCIGILLISMFAQSCGSESSEVSQLVINEIMADNTLTLSDSDGDYSDWIEIYNQGETSAELSRYCLSDDENAPFKWVMPNVTLEPGEYILIFASGKDSKNTETGEYHTGFRLNGKGESVVLASSYYGTVETVTYETAVADISYGLSTDGTYKWFANSTPGRANSTEETADDPLLLNSPYSGLVVTEYMTANTNTLSDSDGEFTDWIEITNISEKTISLDGLQITDNADNLDKWSITGSYILAPNERIIVFMSGKNRCDSELHASFKLGGDDEEIVLSDKHSRVVSRLSLTELDEGISYGFSESGELGYYTIPTPGEENSTVSLSKPAKPCPISGTVRINEVSAAAVSSSTGKAVNDWIELYNDSDETVYLKGYGLSNDETDPYRFTFTSEKIAPHGYLVISAVGTGSATKTTAPFKISSDGETLILTSPDGETLDIFETGKLRIGVTSGRTYGGDRVFFTVATKGAENGEGYTAYVTEPKFTVDPGVYDGSVNVEITAQDGATVYYTTDGSVPTTGSKKYTGAITVEKTCVIRAKAFISGCVSSDTATATYLIDSNHEIPIVSMTGDPDGFFSEERGIYAAGPNGEGHGDKYPYTKSNYWKDWERAVSIEYFVDGQCAIAFEAGTKIFGQYSRAYAQKSFAIHLRDVYGESSVTYPFFGEDNDFAEVKGLVLRAAGQDQGAARLRDAFCSQVVLSSDSEVLTADWQPVALYINGEYWGLYNLREKINEDYLELNYGINKDTVTILKGTSQIELAGSMDEFRKLRKFVAQSSMYDSKNYKYVCSKLDVSNYMDYIIFATFFKNNDLRNSRYYLSGESGAKWKWIIFDLDMSMRSDASNDELYSLEQILEREPIHKYLLRNKAYKNAFIERYAELLNTTFRPSNLTAILDDMAAQIEPEIKNNAKRWGEPTYSEWEDEVAYLRKVCERRRSIMKKQLQEYFGLSDAKMKKLFPNG